MGEEGIAFTLALCAGFALFLGGLAPFFVKTTNKIFLGVALSFSAGAITFLSMIEIFVKSQEAFISLLGEQHALLATMGCFFGGVLFAILLDLLVHRLAGHHHHHHHHQEVKKTDERFYNPATNPRYLINEGPNGASTESLLTLPGRTSTDESDSLLSSQGHSHGHGHGHGHGHSHNSNPHHHFNQPPSFNKVPFLKDPILWVREDWRGYPDASHETQRLKTMALITALALGIHNLPEGLATFMAAMGDTEVGVSLAVALIVHNIPAGVSVSMPIYYSTGSHLRALTCATLAGITEPLGAALGWAILSSVPDTDAMFGVMFGIVAGMMVLISVKELLPTAHSYDHHDKYTTLSFVAGMVIIAAKRMLEATTAAAIGALVLWVISFPTSIMPLWWRRFGKGKSELFFAVANSFAYGVFFCSGLIHMLPEASKLATRDDSGLPKNYPLPFALCASAYLFLFVLQTGMEFGLTKYWKKKVGNYERADETELQMFETTDHADRDHNHGHAHGHDSRLAEGALRKGGFSAFTVMVALNLHSIIEGVALGAQADWANLIVVLIAIAAHKGIDGLALGAKLCRARFSVKFVVVAGLVFSLCTPTGVAIGMVLQSTLSSGGESVALSLASGTFIFMGLNELKEEIDPASPHFVLKSMAMVFGCLSLSLLKIWV